jgi:hypothetical protein
MPSNPLLTTAPSSRREFLAGGAAAIWPWNWFRRDAEIAGISFKRKKIGPDRRRYLWIHGNERTAFDVLTSHFPQVGGRAFFVRSAERNVDLLGGKVDPNRMFSREGADRNLRTLNPQWPAERVRQALDRLDHERPAFLKRLLPRESHLLVVLHNNGPGYSVEDEIPISDLVAFNDRSHPDEFLLCTVRSDFEVLAGGPFNVVLQNRAPQEDDGSLSRLCAARGVRYVNIEAAHGNPEGQRRMLEWLERVL